MVLLLLLLLLMLAQLEEPRQHLQARDFLPADVSELSRDDVVVVELCCCCGGIGVEVGGCRQHVAVAADDFGFVVATFAVVVVVVVDSFLEPEKVRPLNHLIRILLCDFFYYSYHNSQFVHPGSCSQLCHNLLPRTKRLNNN